MNTSYYTITNQQNLSMRKIHSLSKEIVLMLFLFFMVHLTAAARDDTIHCNQTKVEEQSSAGIFPAFLAGMQHPFSHNNSIASPKAIKQLVLRKWQ